MLMTCLTYEGGHADLSRVGHIRTWSRPKDVAGNKSDTTLASA